MKSSLRLVLTALLIAVLGSLALSPARPARASAARTIFFTPTQFNAIMNGYPTPAQMTKPVYTFNAGTVSATFKITETTGITYNAVVTSKPTVVSGKIQMQITIYTWNGQPVPAYELGEFNAALPQLNAYINKAMTLLLGPTYFVTNVTVTPVFISIQATV